MLAHRSASICVAGMTKLLDEAGLVEHAAAAAAWVGGLDASSREDERKEYQEHSEYNLKVYVSLKVVMISSYYCEGRQCVLVLGH
jgi:hypothetical protein